MFEVWKTKRQFKKSLLEFANEVEKRHCEALGVPFSGEFKSYRELERHLFELVEPSTHAKLMKKMILDFRKPTHTRGLRKSRRSTG